MLWSEIIESGIFSVQFSATLAVDLDEGNSTSLTVPLLYVGICVGKHR